MGRVTPANGHWFRPRSLRVRIIVFAALVCLVLLLLIAVAISVLRTSQSASLNKAEQHLHTVALLLGRTFQSRSEFASSLSQLDEPKPPPPNRLERSAAPRPSPGLPPPPPFPRLPPSSDAPSSALQQLMSNTLVTEDGVEGGFYRRGNSALGGYAFPTHEAPGPPKEMPVRERPTIEGLARSAAETGVEQKLRFQGQHDAVLFEAIPLRAASTAGSPVIGAAWFMQRIPGAEGEQHRQLLWGVLGFALIALLICAAAFVILSEVRGGLHSVSARLTAVGSGTELPAGETTTLEEFNNVLAGIDRMARDLRRKVERERTLEAQMAHQERLAAVGQFAAGIAHELRNPLATIRLRTQMSQQQAANDGAAATNSRVVLAEIDRLNAMIGKLLHFARPIQMHSTLLDLAAVARVCAQRWNEEHGAGVVQMYEPAQAVIVSGDREEFRQVFDNLLENAFQAAGPICDAPFAEIHIDVSAGDVTVDVFDRGPGFDDEALQKALQPFYTTKERGTGLGLAIASEIIRAHGGALSVGNRDGAGAFVHFHVPVHSPHGAAEEVHDA